MSKKHVEGGHQAVETRRERYGPFLAPPDSVAKIQAGMLKKLRSACSRAGRNGAEQRRSRRVQITLPVVRIEEP